LFTAVQIALETAAKNLDIILLLLGTGDSTLVKCLYPELILICATLVFGLGLSHARRVAKIFCLILAHLAEVDYNLCGSCVEGVEVSSVLGLQAFGCETVDTPEPIHQLGTHLCELFLRSGKAKILIVGHHPERISATRHSISTAAVSSNKSHGS